MDEKLKIKISIADRVYPLTVDFAQEEGRSASKKIDKMIKQFEENYAVLRQARCTSNVLCNLPLKQNKTN
jgi:hypothetical protein